MSTVLTQSKSTFEMYHDGKLATWALYEQRVGAMAMPFWQAMGDGYGRKVTILAPSRAAVIAKLEEYSSQNKRAISFTEADMVFTYSIYGMLAGGLTAAVGFLGSMPKVSRLGGLVAAGGLLGAVAGKGLSPSQKGGDDAIVLDFGKPGSA